MRLLVAVSLFFMILTTTAMAACDTPPAPGSDPTIEELREAMRIARVKTAPLGVYAVASDCMPGSLLGFYNKRGVIVLADDWRPVGGLTRLVHELRHHYQRENDLPIDECEATRVASKWADENDYVNEAKRERAYGAAECANSRNWDVSAKH